MLKLSSTFHFSIFMINFNLFSFFDGIGMFLFEYVILNVSMMWCLRKCSTSIKEPMYILCKAWINHYKSDQQKEALLYTVLLYTGLYTELKSPMINLKSKSFIKEYLTHLSKNGMKIIKSLLDIKNIVQRLI